MTTATSHHDGSVHLTQLVGCARCGGSHNDMTFAPLTVPMSLGADAVVTHWAMCPRLKEPILLRIVPEDLA